jgi:flavin reductase (DIM6/NTAB) family NADH-FMN oxidoreductase RutF
MTISGHQSATPFHTPTTLKFRHALGDFATGVAIITARNPEGELTGMTVNSFASVSLTPPLVLWNLSLGSPSVPIFERATHYAVNILRADQAALSQRFARRGEDKFKGIKYRHGVGETALLPNCVAWFECRITARHPAGDHLIMVGEVERFRRASGNPEPLLFHHGKYRHAGELIAP